MTQREAAVESVAASLFDLDHNGKLGSVVARALFGQRRISYAEVKKGIEDGIYTESALSNVRARARAAIAAHLSALEAEGMVVVPREPTEEMVIAGMDYDEREIEIRLGRPPSVEECQIGEWQAMIAAAPKVES